MLYSFDTDHAEKYGLEEAIVIKNIQFWISKNKANGKHEHDGRTWTYNSVEAFTKLFPFWKVHQIRRILSSLIEQEVLVTGNYNDKAYDRTLWYAFENECEFIDSHLLKSTNGIAENSKPIPDNKPDSNTHIPDSHESGEDVTPKDRTPSVKTKGNKKQRTPEYKELFRRLDEMFRKGYHCWSEGKPYPTSAKENTMLSTICSRYEQSPAVVEDMIRKYYKKLMNREQYWDHCAFLPSGFVKNEQRIIALDAGLSGGDRLRYQNGDLYVVEKTEL